MSKKALKEQHPWANINLIDILALFDPSKTNKFLSLMVKQLESEIDDRNKRYAEDRKFLLDEISIDTGLDQSYFNRYDTYTLERISTIISIFGKDNISILKDFNEHLNCNRIEKNDISQYKSFDEIREAVKIVSFNLAQKELKSSTHVVYEDENWLMIKPLTFESSKRYGSSTKWCTAMRRNDEPFYNYSQEGILIYIFNKVTNEKSAAYIRIIDTRDHENIIKLFNEQDIETDSYVLQLPKQVMETLMSEYRKGITNENFIKENYPNIYENSWKERYEKNYELDNLETIGIPVPMQEPMTVTEFNGVDGGNIVRLNDEVPEHYQTTMSFNGPIRLDDEATKSLREQLFQGQNDVEDIIKKVKEYTKTSKLKNLWRKLFGSKVVVVGVPEGTMPYEKLTELGEKLNNHTEGNYKFILIWTYNTKQITFTTL